LKNPRRHFWSVILLAAMSAAGFAQTPSGNPAGRWLAENIRGGGVIDRLQTILELGTDGAVSGTGGCNIMSGRARISGDTIGFGPIASTRKACSPAVMNQEAGFFSALEDARTWQLDRVRRKLILLDMNGRAVLVFAQM